VSDVVACEGKRRMLKMTDCKEPVEKARTAKRSMLYESNAGLLHGLSLYFDTELSLSFADEFFLLSLFVVWPIDVLLRCLR
jgi:hypothetical protein